MPGQVECFSEGLHTRARLHRVVSWINFNALLVKHVMRGFFIGHRRYVQDGHWIHDAVFLIGKR